MKISQILRQVQRAWSILRLHGPRKFAASLGQWVRGQFGAPSPERAQYLDKKAQADTEFDARFGVETGGVEHLYGLNIDSHNARFGTNYVASDPAEFQLAMSKVDLDLSLATFVDFGSGRGRALIMAALLPFRKIIGIEFAKELHDGGVANIAAAASHIGDPGRIQQILGDATKFAFPNEPLVLYFYNPFDAPIIAVVARNALASWRENPRPIWVVYLNPIFGKEWLDAGWVMGDEGPGRAIFVPPAG